MGFGQAGHGFWMMLSLPGDPNHHFSIALPARRVIYLWEVILSLEVLLSLKLICGNVHGQVGQGLEQKVCLPMGGR